MKTSMPGANALGKLLPVLCCLGSPGDCSRGRRGSLSLITVLVTIATVELLVSLICAHCAYQAASTTSRWAW